ncbi:hypothetical protein WAI453_005036 [Rhynchosporium graminicola]
MRRRSRSRSRSHAGKPSQVSSPPFREPRERLPAAKHQVQVQVSTMSKYERRPSTSTSVPTASNSDETPKLPTYEAATADLALTFQSNSVLTNTPPHLDLPIQKAPVNALLPQAS